jgi:hypothetical protein
MKQTSENNKFLKGIRIYMGEAKYRRLADLLTKKGEAAVLRRLQVVYFRSSQIDVDTFVRIAEAN